MNTASAFWTRVQALEERLDHLDHTALSTMSDADKVTAMTRMRRLADRMGAGAAVITNAADRAKATEHTTGTPLPDFLAMKEGRTSSQGIGVVKRASKLAHHPGVRDVALAGDVSPDHATAIGEQLEKLSRDLMRGDQVDRAASLFLDRAPTTPPGQLRRATPQILEEVAPEAVPSPHDEAARLAAQRSRAVKDRRLMWGSDGDGSTWFSGQIAAGGNTTIPTHGEDSARAGNPTHGKSSARTADLDAEKGRAQTADPNLGEDSTKAALVA